MKVNTITTKDSNYEKKLRKALFTKGGIDLNMSQIGREIDMNPRNLSNQKRNIKTISFMVAVKIANAIGMSDEEWLSLRKET